MCFCVYVLIILRLFIYIYWVLLYPVCSRAFLNVQRILSFQLISLSLVCLCLCSVSVPLDFVLLDCENVSYTLLILVSIVHIFFLIIEENKYILQGNVGGSVKTFLTVTHIRFHMFSINFIHNKLCSFNKYNTQLFHNTLFKGYMCVTVQAISSV